MFKQSIDSKRKEGVRIAVQFLEKIDGPGTGGSRSESLGGRCGRCAKRDPLRCSFARSYGSCGGSVRWIIDQYTEKMKSKWKQFQRSACAELEFEMIFL
jgi:hypothetical protein